MSSGIDEMRVSFDKVLSNPIQDILHQKLLCTPGLGFKYSSPAAHLLGGVLRKATGTSVLDFAERELLHPLGIRLIVWYADKTGLQSGGMSGLWRSRDFLKLGELYLRKGRWRGQELIPSAFIAESIAIHNCGDFFGESVQYGYLWWIRSVSGYGGFYARGYGGQYLMVIPRLDLVILCTSDWKQPEYREHYALVEQFIIPAVGNR